MSKDNREECPDCKGSGLDILCSEESYGLGYEAKCETCDGTGEVTIGSGADVCEWVEGDRLYETSCNEVSYNYDRSWEFCPYCGKNIIIKEE